MTEVEFASCTRKTNSTCSWLVVNAKIYLVLHLCPEGIKLRKHEVIFPEADFCSTDWCVCVPVQMQGGAQTGSLCRAAVVLGGPELLAG